MSNKSHTLLITALFICQNLTASQQNQTPNHITIRPQSETSIMAQQIQDIREQQQKTNCITCGIGTAVLAINLLGIGALSLTDYLQWAQLGKVDDTLSAVNGHVDQTFATLNTTLTNLPLTFPTPQVNTTALVAPLTAALAPALSEALIPHLPTINTTELANTISSTVSNTLGGTLGGLLKSTLLSDLLASSSSDDTTTILSSISSDTPTIASDLPVGSSSESSQSNADSTIEPSLTTGSGSTTLVSDLLANNMFKNPTSNSQATCSKEELKEFLQATITLCNRALLALE